MQFKHINDPLQFDELWHAAGVSKSLAQNWTNGRPLRIVPSLMQGQGKGSRNFYAMADAYLLAFLHLLKSEGLSDQSLRKVANMFNLWETGKPSNAIKYFSQQNYWFGVQIANSGVMIGPIPYDPNASTQLMAHPLHLNDVHDLIGIQVAVNLEKLRAQVDERLRDYLKEPTKAGKE